jgi:hypothetical protein
VFYRLRRLDEQYNKGIDRHTSQANPVVVMSDLEQQNNKLIRIIYACGHQ